MPASPRHPVLRLLSALAFVVPGTLAGQTCSVSSQCATIINNANNITLQAFNALASQTTPHVTGAQYATLFDAVECRTGVPASLLRVFAYSEGLGSYYSDHVPRHFLEPCQTDGDHSQAFGRYYGSPNGATPSGLTTQAWPL